MASLERVKLGDQEQLLLRQGQLTSSRRGELYKQLDCQGDFCEYIDAAAQAVCDNVGQSEDETIDWSCSLDLPSPLKLSETKISCEGWDGPGDAFVVQGSCNLQFSLTYAQDSYQKSHLDADDFETSMAQQRKDRIINTIFVTIFGVVTVGMLYSFIRAFFIRNFPSLPRLPPVQRLWGGNEDDDDHPGGGGPGFHNHGGGGGCDGWHSHESHDDKATFRFGRSAATGVGAGAAAYGARHRMTSDNQQAGPSRGMGEMRSSTGVGRSSVR